MNPTWNRRTFLTSLGLTTAATTLPAMTASDRPLPVAPAPCPAPPAFAFVSTVKASLGGSRAINTYRVEKGQWTEVQYPLETYFPYALAAHPSLPVLYTASTPQHGPRGNPRRGRATAIAVDDPAFISVETTLERGRHWLNEIGSQPLALATTRPSQIAVSPDGHTLLVADFEGGHYNLLPIADDGSLLPVEHVLKQTGSGPHALQAGPHPHSVLFHPRAPLAYTTDFGTDHLNLLSLPSPRENAHPRITARLSFLPGSGPAHLSLHPAASYLLVSSRLRPAVSVVPLDEQTGAFSAPVSSLPLPGSGFAGPALTNANGTRVYATSWSHTTSPGGVILSTLRLSRSGRLSSLSQQPIPGLHDVATLAWHGTDLVLVGRGGVVTLQTEARTEGPRAAVHVVAGGNMTGLVLRSA